MKKKILILILCVSLITCFGCNNVKKEDNSKKIVTSFYPVYIFTKNLTKGIDDVTVTNITQQTGGCLHDYTLLPKDLVLLNDASLFIINGAGMESFMKKVSDQLPELPVVTASEGIDLIFSEHHHHEDEEEKHDTADKHKAAYNAHVWLSVPNAITEVENIAKALKKTLPDDAKKIETNKQNYIKRLTALDSQLKQELSAFKGTPIITFHEAYGYFAIQYDLLIIDTIETEDGNEPSAKELSELSQKVKTAGVTALFVEPQYKGNSANILASETGAKVYTLNPITSGADSLTAYEDIMKSNLKVFKEALGG